MLKAVGEAVAKSYEQQPYVVVCDEGQGADLKKILDTNGHRYVEGIDPNTL
jgi:hypothetical protein